MSDEKSKVVRLAARSTRPVLQLPPRLSALSESAWRQLSGSLDRLLENADDAFFELADRAHNANEQNLYFEAMREIRVRRPQLEETFRRELSESFRAMLQPAADREEAQFSGLELLEYDDVEEQVAVENMATKAEKRHNESLVLLTTSLSALARKDKLACKLTVSNTPLGPRAACAAFACACKHLDMPIKPKLVLLKLFDRHVVSDFGALYQALEAVMKQQGMLVQPKLETRNLAGDQSSAPPPAAKVAESPGKYEQPVSVDMAGEGAATVFDILKSLLQQAPAAKQTITGTISDAGFNLRFSRSALINVLQEIQVSQLERLSSRTSRAIPEQDLGSLPADSFERLMSVSPLDSDAEEGALAQRDLDIINLVALLFQYILEDANLAPSIKGLIAHLQIPVLKVAIEDKTFFNKDGHPARKLLNKLADACIGWAPRDDYEDEPLYLEIEGIVKRILGRASGSASVSAELFRQAYEDFCEFVDKEQRRAEKITQRMLDVEGSRAAADKARKFVDSIVAEKLESGDVPAPLATLIRDGWSKVLFLRYVQDGADSDAWQESLELVDRLLWSVTPVADAAHREKLLKELPITVDALRTGLQRVGFNPFDMKNLLHDLEAIHLGLLRGTDSAPKSAEQSNKKNDEGTDRGMSSQDSPAPGASDDSLEALDADIAKTLGEVSQESRANAQALLSRLRVGVWVEFTQADDKKLRCRLAAIIASTGRHIFVNRSGVKVAEYSRDELTDMLLAAKVTMLDDSMLFDRALESVISNLRDMKDKPV